MGCLDPKDREISEAIPDPLEHPGCTHAQHIHHAIPWRYIPLHDAIRSIGSLATTTTWIIFSAR